MPVLIAFILPVHAYYVQAEALRPCCSLYGVKDEPDKPLKHQLEAGGVRVPTAHWCFPTDTSRHSLPNLLLQPGKSHAMEAQPGSICLPGAADFMTRLWHNAHDIQFKTIASNETLSFEFSANYWNSGWELTPNSRGVGAGPGCTIIPQVHVECPRPLLRAAGYKQLSPRYTLRDSTGSFLACACCPAPYKVT